jgi:hypothetical protein
VPTQSITDWAQKRLSKRRPHTPAERKNLRLHALKREEERRRLRAAGKKILARTGLTGDAQALDAQIAAHKERALAAKCGVVPCDHPAIYQSPRLIGDGVDPRAVVARPQFYQVPNGPEPESLRGPGTEISKLVNDYTVDRSGGERFSGKG